MDEPRFPGCRPAVPELLRVGRTRFGDKRMRVTPSSRTTFAELDDRSAQMAARL
jgi:hypothetical protein